MPRYVMVIDRKRCIGCMACIVACKTENRVPDEHYRTRVLEKVEGKFPELTMELSSELCNHCDDPPVCITVPPGPLIRIMRTDWYFSSKTGV